jgi:gliding motility-associated-like protein/uncharacterized repeat protein (TIGR01451 family)
LIPGLTGPTGDTNGDGLLNMGETWVYTGTYTVTQEDMDTNGGGDGDIDNIVFVTAVDDEGSPEDDEASEEVYILLNLSDLVTVTKESDLSSVVYSGEVITYTIYIENISNVPVNNVVVDDPLLEDEHYVSGDINNNDILDPGEIWIYEGTYTVTQDDIDNNGINEYAEIDDDGDIDNCVTVSASGLNGLDFGTAQGCVSVLIEYISDAVSVVKEADVESVSNPGDVITYTFTIANIGNYAISELNVTDPLIQDLTFISGDDDNDGLLDVNEVWIYQGTYTVTLEDLLGFGINSIGEVDGDGDIDNIVYVNGYNPGGESIDEASDTAEVIVNFIYIPDAFSPDGDDTNEEFEIIGIAEHYPNFTIRIYNRWGNLVYDYDNNGSLSPEWWDGISNGRLTIDKNKKVPTGTYYYVIDFNDGEREPLVDWIYLTRNE